ncbi:MAG: hypothetical protein HYY16_15900 [Planctomycetes bacterium]|nr:hypothetical protein [Planctomycetota bacterium]
MVPRRAKAGRKKQFETRAWSFVSLQLPGELGRALDRYAFDARKKKAAVIREYLEWLLEREGYLRVVVRKDPEGREVRSYEAIEE